MRISLDRVEIIGRGRCAEIWAMSNGLVAKTYEPTFSAERVDRFAAVARAVRDAGVPSPAVHGRGTHNGREVLVLDRIDGITLWEAIEREPGKAEHYGAALADLHGEVHQVVVPGLDVKLDEADHRVRNAAAEPSMIEEALRRIAAGRDFPAVLVHGDMHPANVMVLDESGDLISIDWDGAKTGPAAFDAARTSYLVSSWALAPGSPEIADSTRRAVASAFEERYAEITTSTAASIDEWRLPAILSRHGEVPSELDLLASQLEQLDP